MKVESNSSDWQMITESYIPRAFSIWLHICDVSISFRVTNSFAVRRHIMKRFMPYSIFVSIVFILCFCVILSEQKIVRDFAKGVSYANFVRNENQRLNTDLLDSLNVQNFSDCGGKCLIHRNCTFSSLQNSF